MRLVTSIPPVFSRRDHRGRELGKAYLRDCVSSWQHNGFDVVSYNRPDEADQVQQLFPDIAVERVPCERAVFPGRLGPPLGDIVDRVPAREPIALLISADLYQVKADGIAQTLARCSESDFVAVTRSELLPDGSLEAHKHHRINLMAFTPSKFPAIGANPDLRLLQLGAPWLDWSMTLGASFFGSVMLIRGSHFLLHRHHYDHPGLELQRRCERVAIMGLRSLCEDPSANEEGRRFGRGIATTAVPHAYCKERLFYKTSVKMIDIHLDENDAMLKMLYANSNEGTVAKANRVLFRAERLTRSLARRIYKKARAITGSFNWAPRWVGRND